VITNLTFKGNKDILKHKVDDVQKRNIIGSFSMIQSYDVGSMPFPGNWKRFMHGLAELYQSSDREGNAKLSKDSTSEYFVEKVTQGIVDKASAGLDIPNYPQFRDMNEMFLEVMSGIGKTKEGYMLLDDSISIRPNKTRLPEIQVLKNYAKEISELAGSKLKLKLCITGPYTLSSNFIQSDTELFEQIAKILGVIVAENILKEKYLQVSFLSLDEPSVGIMDDPTLDYGSEGREQLIKAWEDILNKARSRDVETSMHLHSTRNEIFWDVNSLGVVETHVEDPFYSSTQAKKTLEKMDKLVKASICVTDFDSLINRQIGETQIENKTSETVEQRIANVWKDIKKNRIHPTDFLEETSVLEDRLIKTVDLFGLERVKYAGPECGMGSFPTYDSAVECLKRVSRAVRNVNNKLVENKRVWDC